MPPKAAAFAVVVMGVSGCGKTQVGEQLARRIGARFVEGDSLHPPANVAKMAAGTPLEDSDRWPWLDVIGAEIAAARAGGERLVVSCSALKRVYRERLRAAAGGALAFVHLQGTPELLERRMATRKGHFMPASLLQSQLRTLEPPAGEPLTVTVDIDAAPDDIVRAALDGLAALGS